MSGPARQPCLFTSFSACGQCRVESEQAVQRLLTAPSHHVVAGSTGSTAMPFAVIEHILFILSQQQQMTSLLCLYLD